MYPVKRLDGSTSYHVMDFKISGTLIQDQAVIAEVADTGGGYVKTATTTSLVDMVGTVAGASSFNPHGGGSGTLTYWPRRETRRVSSGSMSPRTSSSGP